MIIRKGVAEPFFFFFEDIYFSYKTYKLKETNKILSMVQEIYVLIKSLEWIECHYSIVHQKLHLKYTW